MSAESTGPGLRAAGVLGATLLLGVVLGVLGAGALANARALKIEGTRGPGGFVAHMLEVIDAPPEQAEALRPVIESFDQRNREVIREANAELREVLEAMQVELAPLLTEDQAARLREFAQRPGPRIGPERRPPPGGARPGGPGGPGGPEGPEGPGGQPGDRPPPRGGPGG